jgi:carbon storage regulator
MLVLSRKVGGKIIIETPEKRVIELVLVQIKGKQIRLGIKSDKDVKIDRAEALEYKKVRQGEPT